MKANIIILTIILSCVENIFSQDCRECISILTNSKTSEQDFLFCKDKLKKDSFNKLFLVDTLFELINNQKFIAKDPNLYKGMSDTKLYDFANGNSQLNIIRALREIWHEIIMYPDTNIQVKLVNIYDDNLNSNNLSIADNYIDDPWPLTIKDVKQYFLFDAFNTQYSQEAKKRLITIIENQNEDIRKRNSALRVLVQNEYYICIDYVTQLILNEKKHPCELGSFPINSVKNLNSNLKRKLIYHTFKCFESEPNYFKVPFLEILTGQNFTPEQKDYQGQNGLKDEFFKQTVENAMTYWQSIKKNY
jgi:hypothetical protein